MVCSEVSGPRPNLPASHYRAVSTVPSPIPIFIGYDPRERAATNVLIDSLYQLNRFDSAEDNLRLHNHRNTVNTRT